MIQPSRTAKSLYLERELVRTLGVSQDRVAVVRDSPFGRSLMVTQPWLWPHFPEVQAVRALVLAGKSLTTALLTPVDTDVELDVDVYAHGECA